MCNLNGVLDVLMRDQEFNALIMQSEQMIQGIMTNYGLMSGMPGEF